MQSLRSTTASTLLGGTPPPIDPPYSSGCASFQDFEELRCPNWSIQSVQTISTGGVAEEEQKEEQWQGQGQDGEEEEQELEQEEEQDAAAGGDEDPEADPGAGRGPANARKKRCPRGAVRPPGRRRGRGRGRGGTIQPPGRAQPPRPIRPLAPPPAGTYRIIRGPPNQQPPNNQQEEEELEEDIPFPEANGSLENSMAGVSRGGAQADEASTSAVVRPPEVLNDASQNLLVALATAGRDAIFETVSPTKVATSCHRMLDTIINGFDSTQFAITSSSLLLDPQTLGIVQAAKRCEAIESKGALLQFAYFINAIIFASHLSP